MDERQKEVIKGLVKMAWADGEVSEAEQTMLTSILLRMGCSEEEVEGLGEEPPEDPRLDEVLPDKESRISTMRALITMSFVDGVLSFAEFDYIQAAAEQLGVTDDELEQLRQEALAAVEEHSAS